MRVKAGAYGIDCKQRLKLRVDSEIQPAQTARRRAVESVRRKVGWAAGEFTPLAHGSAAPGERVVPPKTARSAEENELHEARWAKNMQGKARSDYPVRIRSAERSPPHAQA